MKERKKSTKPHYTKAKINAIIMLLDRVGFINTTDVAVRIGCSWFTSDKYLKYMHKKGMLVKKGKFLYNVNRSQLSFD